MYLVNKNFHFSERSKEWSVPANIYLVRLKQIILREEQWRKKTFLSET